MSVNIKQADGLKRLSQTIEFYKSSSSISIPQLFTGSYNDLTDKPIVDGNATIESIETTQSSFYVQDGSGNTIALIDDQGVHSIDFYANGESVKQHMSSSTGQLNDLSGDLTLHKNNQDIHITSEERKRWNDPLSDESDTLYINDAYGNTIAIFDANGLTTTDVIIKFNNGSLEISSKFVEIDNCLTSIQNKNNDQDGRLDSLETATEKLDFIDASELDTTFSIVDTDGNPIAQFDASGLTTTEVTIADSKGSPIQVGAKIEGIEDRVATAEGEIDTLQDQVQTLGNNFSSHTDDTTIHITASERSTWDTVTSKANQSDLDTTNQNLATEVTNRQTADQVLQGNIDTEAQTRANEDAAINERTAEIEASENGVLSITDPSGNAIAQFDANGLLVTEIQTTGNVIVGGNITTAGNFDSKELSANNVLSRGDIEAQGTVKGATITATGNVSAADVTTSSITSLNSTISTINNNASALEGRVETAEGEIDTLQSQTSTLIASDSGKSVRTIANEELAAALIPSDAQEALDTLQEIADWIQDHPDDAAAMNSKIEANTTAINNHINDAEPRIESLEGKTANIEDSAESDAFTIYDKHNQPGFQVDAEGTTVSSLKAESVTSENINGTYVSASEISTESLAVGDIDSVEQAIIDLDQSITDLGNDLRPNSHTHDNKDELDGTTASFTTELKEKLDGIEVGANKIEPMTEQEIIDIVNAVFVEA